MAMPPEIEALCRGFCRALYSFAAGKPETWFPIKVVGVQRRLFAPETLKAIIAVGVEAGWLVSRGDSVALTERGALEFAAAAPGPSLRPKNWKIR